MDPGIFLKRGLKDTQKNPVSLPKNDNKIYLKIIFNIEYLAGKSKPVPDIVNINSD